MRRGIVLIWIAIVLSACNWGDKNVVIPVNDFFKSQDRSIYRLSPNGKFLSYLKLQDNMQNLVVEDIETGEITQLTHLKEKKITFYNWVSDDELIYYKEKNDKRFLSNLFIVNKNGKQEKELFSNENTRMRIIDDQLIDDKFILISSNKRDSTVFDVYRLNVRDGKIEMAAQNPGNFTNWLSDSKGRLKMAISTDGVDESLWYRDNEAEPFKKIVTNNFKTKIWPIAFSESKPNVVYAISNVNRDKNALIELDCSTGKETSVLFANDSLNVVDAQYSKHRKMVDFVVYETWKKSNFYLNKSSEELYKKIGSLLPKNEFRIIHRDKNEQNFVVRSFTDRNPGSYFLYNSNTNNLKKLSDINSAIDSEYMCETKPISFLTRDSLMISGYLTLPKNSKNKKVPVVVLPHNGPGLRDVWEYNADVQFLANRGYAVLQINYRGSKGYGKEFYAAGFKQWGHKIKNDIEDGVKWIIQKQIADSKRIAIYGTGFGGYIALNAAIENPDMFKCVGANKGVLNLFSYLKSIPPFYQSSLQMYYEVIGNPVEDADNMRQVSPVFHADKLKIPVFITSNSKDPRVNSNDVIQFIKELKKNNVPVTYLDRDDGISSPNREAERQRAYTALEKFLESNLGKR